MNSNKLKIHNARVLTPYRILENATILIADGKIIQVTQEQIDFADAVEIDAQGKYVSPGFIDIHVHGGGGHDFMDGSEEAFLKIAETHARYGTTGLMPTTLTSELDELYHTLDLYKQANRNNTKGAKFLGMHLEGPYFAMSQRGAQDPRYIRNPNPEEYMDILSRSSDIKRWSAAPELDGAIAFGNHLRSKGIL